MLFDGIGNEHVLDGSSLLRNFGPATELAGPMVEARLQLLLATLSK